MKKTRRCLIGASLLVAAVMSVGCAQIPDLSPSHVFHELKPHRLWRWNRGPAPSYDAYFSVPDVIVQPQSVPAVTEAPD